MSRILSIFSRPLLTTLLLSGSLLSACGGSSTVSPGGEAIDRTIFPLTGAGGTTLLPKVIKGTYGATCKVNPGATWDLTLNTPSDRTLSVALNDTFANCPLTVNSVSVQVGAGPGTTDYPLMPPIVLGIGYAASASAVNLPSPGGGLAFYANAKTDFTAPVYSRDFTISVMYSDDASYCGAKAPPAVYAKVTATATGSAVPPPNYNMAFDSLQLVVDANNVVQPSSSGNVVLKFAGQAGEEYKTFDESTPCCQFYSFAEIDSLYKTGGPISTVSISGTADINIPWSSFALSGFTLPKTRTVIAKHTDGGGVYSYELIQVVFPGP